MHIQHVVVTRDPTLPMSAMIPQLRLVLPPVALHIFEMTQLPRFFRQTDAPVVATLLSSFKKKRGSGERERERDTHTHSRFGIVVRIAGCPCRDVRGEHRVYNRRKHQVDAHACLWNLNRSWST